MKKKKSEPIPDPAPGPAPMPGTLARLPIWIFSLTLFCAPLFPDEKLNRLKLMALGAGLIAAACAWAAEKAAVRTWTFYRSPLDLPLLVYAASAALYYLSSANPAVAASELQRMFFSLGAYLVAVQVCAGSACKYKQAAFAWMAGLCLISAYGILQKSGGVGAVQVPKMDRVFATFGNPIFFAAFLIASIPPAISLLIGSTASWEKAFIGFTLASASLALFFTGTRAAFLALPVSLALFYILIETRQGWAWARALWRAKTRIVFGAFALAVLHAVLSATSAPYRSQKEKLAGVIQASRLTATSQTHTLIWKDVLRMWLAHPWLGTGYGTFHVEFPTYASRELRAAFPERERIINDAHNEYLQILAETGIVGLLIFASLIAVFYVSALKRFYARPEGGAPSPTAPSAWPAGLLAGATALLIQNFFSVDMRFIISSTYLFLAMGLLESFHARPLSVSWPQGGRGTLLKGAWYGFFLLAGGLIGFGRAPRSFYLLGIYRCAPDAGGRWSWSRTPALGPGLLPALFRPYLAQKLVARSPDFFDEKLLDSARTIQDLENLVRQYPGQWKYWEKLGYALAKEIQRVNPEGRKVNDMGIAEMAIRAYVKAHELNPQAEGPANNLGNIFYTIQRVPEAIAWWNKTIAANPDKVDARLNLGLAYYYQGKIKESATQFQEVLKRDPNNEKAIVMLKHMVE